MRRSFVFLILLCLGIVLFIFTLRSIGPLKIIEVLKWFSGPQLILVFIVLFMAQVFVSAIKWKVIIGDKKGEEISFLKILLARWAGFAISFLTPAALLGGEPVRFLILKRESKIPSNRIISSIIVDKLLLVLASSAFLFRIIYVQRGCNAGSPFDNYFTFLVFTAQSEKNFFRKRAFCHPYGKFVSKQVDDSQAKPGEA